jgi:phage repressor protein C with HTH and peptisase S24 domain
MKILTHYEEAELLKKRFLAVENKAEFARKYKVPGGASMINQHLSANRPMSLKAAKAYAAGFGCDLAEISPRWALTIGAAMASGGSTTTRKVPVVGTAQLGDGGYWAELEYPMGHGDGFIDWQSDDENAYALRCKGDSMRPRIKEGEYVILEPNHPINSGDEVLVKDKSGRVMVKELLFIRDGMVALDSVNETHPKITIPQEDIEFMHFVSAIVKSSRWHPDMA